MQRYINLFFQHLFMNIKKIVAKIRNKEPLVLRTKNDVLQINAKYDSQDQILGYEIIIRVTYKCNLNCRFCFIPYKFEVKEKWIERLLHAFKNIELEGSNVILSGGEPTLYPRYFEMLEKLKYSGTSVITQTNAVLFSKDTIFKKLNMKNHSFFISFPSPFENEYNYITNSNQFKNFLKGVRKLSQNYNISLNYVLYKENYRSFAAALDLVFKNFNLKNTRIAISNLGMLSKFDHTDKLAKYTDIIDTIRGPIYSYKNKINIGFTVSGGCSFPLCVLNKIIPLKHEAFFKAVEDNIGFKNFEKQFYKNKKCLSCNYIEYCQGFPAEYIKKFGDMEIEPIF